MARHNTQDVHDAQKEKSSPSGSEESDAKLTEIQKIAEDTNRVNK